VDEEGDDFAVHAGRNGYQYAHNATPLTHSHPTPIRNAEQVAVSV
jgi:hypothetical protein